MRRLLCLALLCIAGALPARAGDLADFNAALEAASSHNRVAIGYLRTGNADLAALEIDRFRESWAQVTRRFGGKRPDAFDGNALYPLLFTGVSMRLVGADIMLKSGRLDAARDGLLLVRDDFSALRKASGIVVLADCVRDANAAMDRLYAFDDRAQDMSKADTGLKVAQAAAVYGHELTRCDAMASDAVRASDEFRRLIDGAQTSLLLIAKAVTSNDADLLHRVLIELRSFDTLLAFRFG